MCSIYVILAVIEDKQGTKEAQRKGTKPTNLAWGSGENVKEEVIGELRHKG